MEQSEIIRMALEAGFETEDWANGTHVIVYESGREIDITNELERFYELAYATGATHEREACAKVCEDLYKHLNYDADCRKLWPHTKMMNDQYAEAIRSRNEK